LVTTNEELQNRNKEVVLLNNDLINLLSSINMPVIMMGTDLVVRRITPQAEKVLNVISSDIGRGISKIKLSVDIPDFEKILSDVIESLEPKTFEIESGEGNWYSVYIRPYRTLDNKINGVVAIFIDITEHKKAQQIIEEARAYAENIVETMREPLIVLDTDLKVISANRSFYQTFKVNHKETQGRLIYDLGNRQWGIPKLRKLLEEILPKNNTFDNYEIEHDFETIGPKTMLFNARRLATMRMILITIEDITERKKAEEKLKETMKMKSDFISMVSHELRTPLTVIKEGIALVTDGSAGEINEEQKEMLGLSKKHVDRLAKLINDVLDFQKLEAGRMKNDAQPNDINEIVRDVYETMTLAARDRGVDLLLELDDGLPRVGFDNDKITRVLTNLADNAMKFTEKGNIVIKTSKKKGMIHVSVSDTGCGIKKKDLSRVFGRFEQLSSGGERKAGGTGLGLAICKGIIEQHNGEIWVDSVFGKGSKFTFALPIYNIEEPFRKYVNDGIKEASTNNTGMSLVLVSIADFDKLKQKLSREKITSTLKDVEAILENDLHRGKGRPNRITDTVFRFSNEIFIVLANCGKKDIPAVKERLEQKLDEYLAVKNLADKVKLFFGCVTYPDDAVTSEELIKKTKELHPIVSAALSV
jgi:two-component system CheB/CheR fusion protein